MKFLVYFLSFCIISISCINCEDANTIVINKNQGSSVTEGHSNPAAAPDNCSPLCTCNCCGQPSVLSIHYPLEKLVIIAMPNHYIAVYNNRFISSFTQTIWQPPKLNISTLS